MDENIIISLSFKGTQYDFETRFVQLGYIHQLHINVQDENLIFEFDEERDYRIINASGSSSSKIDVGLLEALMAKITELHK